MNLAGFFKMLITVYHTVWCYSSDHSLNLCFHEISKLIYIYICFIFSILVTHSGHVNWRSGGLRVMHWPCTDFAMCLVLVTELKVCVCGNYWVTSISKIQYSDAGHHYLFIGSKMEVPLIGCLHKKGRFICSLLIVKQRF
jgi:hypothetical protein